MNPITSNSTRSSEVVVGFEEEAQTIIDELIGGSSRRQIIAIAGMGGQGKTTLAKKIYDDPSVQLAFHKLAWCTVSQSYNTEKLFSQLLSWVGGGTCGDLDEQLYKCLKGRKYLIVMDDIWDMEAWAELERSFPDDNNGSRVLFTTRIHQVPLQASQGNCKLHQLRAFNDEECFELLQKRLFSDQNQSCPPEFAEEVGKICNGLPMGIALVAGILAGQNDKSLDSWTRTIRDLRSQMVTHEECKDVLELSYSHLPESLKLCFLYLGKFEEDEEFIARKLKRLWISEGLVQCPQAEMETGMTVEEIATSYLEDLVARSLVIVTKRGSLGGIKQCKLHDLLWQLSLAKAKELKFFQVIRMKDDDVEQPVVVDSDRLIIRGKFDNLRVSNQHVQSLHSYLVYPVHRSCFGWLRNFDQLRVLDLEDFICMNYFPKEICCLLLLRYFAIQVNGACSIDESIGNLGNLETLVIDHECHYEVVVPDTIWKLKKLRYLYIAAWLLIGEAEGYSHDRQLDHVWELAWPILDDGKVAEEFLRRMPNLLNLKCYYRGSGVPYPVALDFLTKLESLNIRCHWDWEDMPLLAGFEFPLFPWFKFPSTLRKLVLLGFKFGKGEMSAIGKLPNLEVFELSECKLLDGILDVGDDEFSKLKHLELDMTDIREWNLADDPFPSLRILQLESYGDGVKEIPLEFGDIPTLQVIEISVVVCDGLVDSAKRIRDQQFENGNEDFQLTRR